MSIVRASIKNNFTFLKSASKLQLLCNSGLFKGESHNFDIDFILR